jgi:hypothetical protein
MKTIHFTRLIKTDERLREFNFIRFGRSLQDSFDADVVDNRGNRILFRVQKQDNVWKVVPALQLPDWILRSEKSIHDVIEDELQNL